MTVLSLSWYNAVPLRCSRRSYDKTRPIEKDIKDKLHRSCNEFRPFAGCRVEFVSEPPDDIFSHALGFYGNIKNAPAFLAFIGDMSDDNVQEKIGYTGEGIVLEATSLGMGTCWVALTYRSKSALSMIKLSGREKLLAVSPVGHTPETRTLGENVFSAFGANRRRKPLAGMVSGLDASHRPEWAAKAVEAARLAPSATNRQPWSFHIQKDGITVSISGSGPQYNVSKRLDCGIAMLHIELGAMSCGVSGMWELLKQPQVARFKIDRS
ncbi:MAG: nitroreductase family protein [Dehalococcoidia bacterium]